MSDKTYKYIVRLTPVGSYFFGGETTFGDGKNQNYLVRSCILPQVSAVLGVLRYEILRRNNLLETGAENDAEKKKNGLSISERLSILRLLPLRMDK